jgi:hypothetical protein
MGMHYPDPGNSKAMSSHTAEFEALVEALKVSVATLRERGIQFMVGGSVAVWARGGPEPHNDLDLMVKPTDADAALAALEEAGLRPEHPPEEWLVKAWHGDVLIDLIFCPAGVELTDEVFARADVISLMAVSTPVMALEDVLVTMLCAVDEHSLDYSRLVLIARTLREQIDFSQLRNRTATHPYAAAFFTLVEALGVAPASPAVASRARSRVRVLPASG